MSSRLWSRSTRHSVGEARVERCGRRGTRSCKAPWVESAILRAARGSSSRPACGDVADGSHAASAPTRRLPDVFAARGERTPRRLPAYGPVKEGSCRPLRSPSHRGRPAEARVSPRPPLAVRRAGRVRSMDLHTRTGRWGLAERDGMVFARGESLRASGRTRADSARLAGCAPRAHDPVPCSGPRGGRSP